MPDPAVSVVIPTYQRRDRVVRAVRSVLAQTFQDFEVVVVDDGSSDGTAEALEGLDPRLVYCWQENRGVAAARNAGLRLARGEIVAFLDSDDRWLPDHLAVVTEVLARHPEAVLVSTSPEFSIGGRDRPAEVRLVDALPELLVENGSGYPTGLAVRRTALAAVRGFDEALRVMEGGELCLRLAALGPFCFLRRRTFVREVTRDSVIGQAARAGAYFEAFDRVTASARAVVERTARPDRAALERRLAGRERWHATLRALAAGEEASAGAALAEACRLAPELSHRPAIVAMRITMVGWAPESRLRNLRAAAGCWPEPRSDTALFLRLLALALALRRGEVRVAAALLAEAPLTRLPGFLVRNRSLWSAAALILDMRHRRGPEPAARGDAAPSPSEQARGARTT